MKNKKHKNMQKAKRITITPAAMAGAAMGAGILGLSILGLANGKPEAWYLLILSLILLGFIGFRSLRNK